MVHNARLAIKPAVVDPPPANPSDTPTNPSGGSTNPSGGSTNPSGGGSTNPSGTPADQSVIASPSNFVYTQDAKCAGDNNKVYVAGDGTYYRLQCNYQASRTLLSKPIAGDLKDCMEKCSAINGCLSVMFNARPPIGSAEIQGECSLFGEGDAATQSNEQHDFAYAIDPPAQDVADFPNQLCTTACPFSDGMTYASEYGENFKMDCGKRHGGTILSMGYTDTLTESSTIKHARKSAIMEPITEILRLWHLVLIVPIAWAVPTLVEVDADVVPRRYQAPSKGIDPPKTLDTSCGNQGLAYAIFPNTKTDGTVLAYDAPAYSTFDPTVYKTANPQVSGQTTSLGVTDCHTIYGNTPNNYEYVTVNHRGYIFAAQSGEHTFSFTSVDNIVMFWLGPKAYSGYTRANADIIQPWVAGASSAVTFKTTFVQGQYYPIRIIFANGGGPGNFKMSVQAPDGTVVVDDATGASKILVQFSCDGVSAPPFPAFGAELAPYPGLAATEACPALDQQFRIVDGRLYKIFCSAYGTGGSNFENTQRSLQDCLKACTADARCNEIDFVGPAGFLLMGAPSDLWDVLLEIDLRSGPGAVEVEPGCECAMCDVVAAEELRAGEARWESGGLERITGL
ncbi:hypothetical protein MMC11_008099 [Xylographa trunciseda]|nr:hypothetical protein [Xylographa trunciseda]